MESASPSPIAAGVSKKSTLRSGIVYVVASAAPRAVGFLLLPIYTRILSPSDYGELSVALAAAALAIAVFSFGLETAVTREIFQLADDPVRRKRLILSTWTFLLVAPLAAAAVVSVVLAPVLAASDILTPGRLALSLAGAAVFVGGTIVPLAVLRAENRLRKYLIINAASSLSTTVLVLIAVAVLDLGVTGWLAAMLVGYVITLIVAAVTFPYERPSPYDRGMVRASLRLGLPVMPHLAAMLTLQLADRILVAGLISTAAAGIYSLASNMALPMMLAVLGFGQAFMPTYALAGKVGHGESALEDTMTIQVALVSLFCVACALLAPSAIHLVVGPEFQEASSLTGWIVLGYGFWGLSQLPMNVITLTYGRTKGLVLVSGASALANVGLIVVFARPQGLEAVAIASAVGYAVLLAAVCVAALIKRARVEYPWRQLVASVAIGIVGYAAGALTTDPETLMGAVGRSAWIVATAVAMGLVVLGSDRLRGLTSRWSRSQASA